MLLECQRKEYTTLRKLTTLAVLLLASSASGQSAAVPATSSDAATLSKRLAEFAIASEDLQQHLPSFACKETLTSQELRDGKVKSQVTAEGDLRVERDAAGKLAEHFSATKRNGKPITPDKLRVPLFVFGGFKDALDPFQADRQPCFIFRQTGNRIDFASVPDSAGTACAKQNDMTGFALLDLKGDVIHLERTVALAAVQERNAAPFSALLDLSRVDLGRNSFLLSTHVVADMQKGKSSLHWEAAYTDCRLFAATVTLSPANPLEQHSDGVAEPPPATPNR
jgi:hypothetical protein